MFNVYTGGGGDTVPIREFSTPPSEKFFYTPLKIINNFEIKQSSQLLYSKHDIFVIV